MVEKVSMKRKGEFPSRKYSVVLPGNEIPEWFSCVIKREGATPSFHLSSPTSNGNLIGIAWCAIFQYPHPGKPVPEMPLEVAFKMNDFALETLHLSDPLKSQHIWIGLYAGCDLPQLSKGKRIMFKFETSDIEAVYFGGGSPSADC